MLLATMTCAASTCIAALWAGPSAAGPGAAASRGAPTPLIGDVVHGEALLKAADVAVRVDGAWLGSYTDEQAVARLGSGKDGFPAIESDNVLDRWDVLAFIKSRNTALADLLMGGDAVLLSSPALDDNARKRLLEQARVPVEALAAAPRVFAVYKVGAAAGDGAAAPSSMAYSLVSEKDTKRRDELKKDARVGFVVFMTLAGFRGGAHEVAFAVDKSIRLVHVVVRAPDGSAPPDLNQAAARFVGKGARGQYAQLKAGGPGRSVAELERPLSDAFLVGMESVYMFEVAEREYFAFDN